MKIDNLTVVAPMLHEEGNVDHFMQRLIAALEMNATSWKIIAPIMRDDPTLDYLRPYPVEVVDRPKELGSALAIGLRQALRYPGPVLTMVSDLSNIPEEMGLLLNSEGDVVIGARGPEIPRRLLSRVVNSILLGPSSDYTNAYRLYRKLVVERVLPDVKSKVFAFLPEFIFRALRAGFSVSEVEVSHPPRASGYSKLSYRSNLTEYLRFLAWRYVS